MWAKDRLRKYRSILDMLPVFPIQRWTQTTATVDWRLWHRCYRLSCTCLSTVGAMSFQFHNPFPLQSSLKYIWNWFSKSFLEYSASFHVFFFNIQEGLSESHKMDNVCYIFFFYCVVMKFASIAGVPINAITHLCFFPELNSFVFMFAFKLSSVVPNIFGVI